MRTVWRRRKPSPFFMGGIIVQHVLGNGKVLAIEVGQKKDAAEMVAYMNRVGGESDNLTFGENGSRHTVAAEEVYLENAEKQPNSVVLLGRIEGELTSVGTLTGSLRERMLHNADLGVTVRKAYWRMGVGEHMMAALIQYAEDTGVLRTIHLQVRADNLGAIALYEKMGFVSIGRHRDDMCVDGLYFDTLLMDLYLR